MTRASRSHTATKPPPARAQKGMRRPLSPPTSFRAMWGTMSPTKPSSPAKLTLAPASLVVKLKLANDSENSVALSPSDYTVAFKKDGAVVDAIPAGAIGEYQVVVKGTINTALDPNVTNTTNQYVTADLTVNVTLPVTLPDAEWVTYYNEKYNLKTPDGYQAHYVSAVSGTTVTAATVDYMPKSIPLLLHKTTATTTTFEVEEDVTNSFSTSTCENFVGVPSDGVMPVDKTPAYILMNNKFVAYETNSVIGANRCFLTAITAVAPAPVLGISTVEGTTSLGETLIVEDDDAVNEGWYDLQGRKLARKPTQKGVYIRNGKKVVIKK